MGCSKNFTKLETEIDSVNSEREKIKDQSKSKSKTELSPHTIVKRMLTRIKDIPCNCFFIRHLLFFEIKLFVQIIS